MEYNVGIDEKIRIDSTEHSIPEGYYSFDDLKEFLENLNCTVTLEKSGKCSITPDTGKSLNLMNIAQLLGFNKNATLSKKEMSPYIVNVHGGLDSVSVLCNRVNLFRNFKNNLRTERVCKILVPGGNLWGIRSEHSFGDTIVPLEKGEFSYMVFEVQDESYITDKDSYTLYLDCELR